MFTMWKLLSDVTVSLDIKFLGKMLLLKIHFVHIHCQDKKNLSVGMPAKKKESKSYIFKWKYASGREVTEVIKRLKTNKHGKYF